MILSRSNTNIPFIQQPYYVKAIHDYQPMDNKDESASCLYFEKGSLIEVLNKDESGWWDGQCGSKRGWFPSNFVSSGDLTRQHLVHSATTQKMAHPCFNFPNVSHDNCYSIIKNAAADDMNKRSTTVDISSSMERVTKRVADLVQATCDRPNQVDIQRYNSRIVSSIKSMLVEFNMINKDSYLLNSRPELGKQRKIILTALNRLITKCKEICHVGHLEDEHKQISIFANELISAIHHLIKMLTSVPKRPLSNSTDSTINSEYSSLFDTPRPSLSSESCRSITHSCSNSLLRQYLSEKRHSNLTLPAGKKELLRRTLHYQTEINDLIEKLKASLENYLKDRYYTHVILDMTRKVMDAVMSFLSVAEHVCSNISEFDYSRRAFMIPKDPSHVSFIITKESVYSAITNLVTTIRILTEPSNTTRFEEDHLYSCCQGVLETTGECTVSIRVCLGENMQELSENTHSQLSNFSSSTLIQQHINKQQQLTNAPQDNMNAYKRLSLASSKESFQSSQSFSSLSADSMTSSASATTVRILGPVTVDIKKNLPPLPPKSPNVKSQDIMKSPPLQPLKARLSRGISVSSLRSSFSKSQRRSAESESKKLPSWISMHASVVKPEKNSHVDISAPFLSDQIDALKKEPDYHFLKPHVLKEDMILNAQGEVIGATVEALVQRLTLHEKSSDPDFVRAFFYTFRLFSNPLEFLNLLIDRYNLPPPPSMSKVQANVWSNRVLIPVRFRVYHVMKTWLESYFDHGQDFCIKDRLFSFVSNDMSKVMPGPAKRMVELITKTFHTRGVISYDTSVVSLNRVVSASIHNTVSKSSQLFHNLAKFDEYNDSYKYPQPILGKALRNSFKKNSTTSAAPISVNCIHSVELARQLTLMENYLFCQIKANEMVGQEFKKKVEHSHALHVKAMIQRSTQITGWVSDTILKEKNVKKRSSVLKHWIKVGDACLQYNNYNTLMAIRSALDSASIIRLKKTWDCLSLKHRAIWETIQKVTDSQRNFAEYRQRLRQTMTHCLPFLGIYLTDMTFIDDGNPDCRASPNGNQLINFNKYVKMAKILNEIQHFQIPYKFIEVEEIQKYIKCTLQKVQQDDQLFYTRSLKCEPKEEE